MKLAELTIGEKYTYGSRDFNGKIIRSKVGIFQGVGHHRGTKKAKFEIEDKYWLAGVQHGNTRQVFVTPQQILGTVAEIDAEIQARKEASQKDYEARQILEARRREKREMALELRQQEQTRIEALLNGHRIQFDGSWVITLPEGVDSLTALLNRLEA